MPECHEAAHQHKGKSSEKLLDKEKILNAVPIARGQTILDAGCGDGYMAKAFAQLTGESGKVYAMDVDEASIQALRSAPGAHTIEAFTGDISSVTKLASSSIDLVYLSTVLHGFTAEQMTGFISEVQRLLKPGGVLAILEIKKKDTPFGPPLSIRMSPEELKTRMPFAAGATVDINDYFYLQIFEKQR